MRLGRAIEEVICHHGVAHALWAGGRRQGVASTSHTTWWDGALGMQLTLGQLTPLTCQCARKCVLDLCWPVVWLNLFCYMRPAPEMWFISTKISLYTNKFIHDFCHHLFLCVMKTTSFFCRINKLHTYKSSPSKPHSSAMSYQCFWQSGACSIVHLFFSLSHFNLLLELALCEREKLWTKCVWL